MTEIPKTNVNERPLKTIEIPLSTGFIERAISPEAREFWANIEAEGTPEEVEEARREIARVLLNVNYLMGIRAIKKTAQIEGKELLETDEDIIALSIELTTR